MMAGLLEPPRELEFLEPFQETMSLKYKKGDNFVQNTQRHSNREIKKKIFIENLNF